MAGELKCVTNDGYKAAAKKQASAIKTQAVVDSAIQVAVALWQRNSSKSIANMQRELADQQVQLAEQVQAHAIIFWPEEAELVADAFAVPRVTTTYVGLTSAWAQLVTEAEATGRAIWIDTARKQCFAPSRCEDARWQRNEQLIKADMVAYASRQDEARTQVLNDLRYERQLAVLGLGRGKVALLLSYQNIAQVAGLTASAFLEGTINSGLRAFGYYPAREYNQPAGWAQGIRQTWSQNVYTPTTKTVATNVPNTVERVVPVPTYERMPDVNISRPSKENEMEMGMNSNTAQGLPPYYEKP